MTNINLFMENFYLTGLVHLIYQSFHQMLEQKYIKHVRSNNSLRDFFLYEEVGQGGIEMSVIPSNISTTLFIEGRRAGSSWTHQSPILIMFSRVFLSTSWPRTSLFNSLSMKHLYAQLIRTISSGFERSISMFLVQQTNFKSTTP